MSLCLLIISCICLFVCLSVYTKEETASSKTVSSTSVASLERFELEERQTADVRKWRLLASSVPQKNKVAEQLVFTDSMKE